MSTVIKLMLMLERTLMLKLMLVLMLVAHAGLRKHALSSWCLSSVTSLEVTTYDTRASVNCTITLECATT